MRRYVHCIECFKKRPLLKGMDPESVPNPFVCWMNKWDELHASCYIPEQKVEHLERYSYSGKFAGNEEKKKRKLSDVIMAKKIDKRKKKKKK